MNTRFDYEYIREHNQAGWQDAWRVLLEGRFCVENNELVEDVNAPIFRLGFTVEEVSEAIGFSGPTNREIEFKISQPDRFDVDGNEIVGWLGARTQAKITELKAQKILDIQREKCRMRDAGVIVNDTLFDTDSAAQSMYTQTLTMMQMSPGFIVEGWKASPGVYVDLDQELLMQVLMAWKELINTLTLKQAEKETEVKSLMSVVDVENYNSTDGWL